MSLASSAECFLRAEDQALQALFPTDEQPLPNSFDDFFSNQFYEESDDNKVKLEREDSLELFADLADGNGSNHAVVNQSDRSSPQPWRKGLWSLKPGSQIAVEKTRKPQNGPPSHISPAHLVANDNFALRSPRSSTRHYQTKSLSPNRLRKALCQSPPIQQSIERDMSLSPSPMYARTVYHGKNDFVDVWQQDLQDFNLDLNDDYPEAFAFSGADFVEPTNYAYGHLRRLFVGEKAQMERIRSATMFNMARPTSQKQPSSQSQELSARMNANLNATNRNMFTATPDPNDTSYKFINDDLPTMSDWTTTESMHSSNSSHNSHFSNGSIENHQNTVYTSLPEAEIWSPPASSAHESYPEIVQPKPRRATHHLLNSQLSYDSGLGISYPNPDEIGIAVPYQPANAQDVPTHHRKSSYPHQTHIPYTGLGQYPALPPPLPQFTDFSPFSTPRRRTNDLSRSPSPSPTRSSRLTKQRSPSRRDASQHRRVKSIHRQGPKEAETPRHRSCSRGRQPRTPKTSKVSGDSFGAIGFVNFTPKDASKLLNDVAPSGSSKTRARREQEARDKRKKMSEAAIEAVRRAGGDVSALENAIFT